MAEKMVARVEKSKCDNSPFCMVMRGCPTKCVDREGMALMGHKPQVDQDDCAGCGKCVALCPHGAVELEKVRA